MAERHCSAIPECVLSAGTGSHGNYFDLAGVEYYSLESVELERQKHVSRLSRKFACSRLIGAGSWLVVGGFALLLKSKLRCT